MPTLVASLPMYASNVAVVDALWRHLAARLAQEGADASPPPLVWPCDYHEHWLDPGLLLSQSCGFPLVTELSGKVRVVGTFGYSADGCEGVLCRSALVVRADAKQQALADFRAQRVAYNNTDSQSGYNSLRAMVAPLAVDGRFFSTRQRSGGHRKSVELVRDGQADIAAVDCVTLAGLRRYLPEVTEGTRVLAYSDSYPGLPLITSLHTSDAQLAQLRSVLAAAVQDPAIDHLLQSLFIKSFEPLEQSDYQVCLEMRDRARAVGCTDL